MKRFTRSVAIAFVAGATGAGALGLTAGAAAAQSRSLDVTLGFIRDKIVEQGQFNYASTTRDPSDGQTWDNQFTVEASNVTRDDGDCTVSFHWHSTVDGKPAQDLESAIQFKLFTSATITSMDEDVARLNADGGHAGWVSSMRPPVWVLLVRKSNGHTNTVDFRDRDMAERVAKAMRHAGDLCGGTSSQPF